jgi:hypothetical protein
MFFIKPVGRLLRPFSLVRRLRALLRFSEEPTHTSSTPHVRSPEREAGHADERTIRRTAEAQQGGVSSEASTRMYEHDEKPPGLHGRGQPRADRSHRRASSDVDAEEEVGPVGRRH